MAATTSVFEISDAEAQRYNEVADALPSGLGHPCLCPRLVRADQLAANDYNPNQVPDPELDLLEQSIRQDGMTMPIVTYHINGGGSDEGLSPYDYEIVDGFHRYLVLTDRLGATWIPVSVIDKEQAERMFSTVRHNRARGDHTTQLMGQLVDSLREDGKTDEQIATELGMEVEEIVRLKQVIGAADILASDEYSQSWGVQGDDG